MENENVTVTLKHSDISTAKLTKKGFGTGSLKFYGAIEGPLMTDSDTLASVRHGMQVFFKANCDPDTTDVNVHGVDASGSEIDLDLETHALHNDGKVFSFIMPEEEIEIVAEFTDKTPTTATNFTDVPADAYYADAVAWAVGEGITTGTSDTTFSPNTSCTRAQMVTFLWRAAGSPAPTGTTSSFSDVRSGQYYTDAVQWAVEKGITTGTSDTKMCIRDRTGICHRSSGRNLTAC